MAEDTTIDQFATDNDLPKRSVSITQQIEAHPQRASIELAAAKAWNDGHHSRTILLWLKRVHGIEVDDGTSNLSALTKWIKTL